MGGWSTKLLVAKDPQELGRLLLAFEDKVLAERLSKDFVVTRRVGWLLDVASAPRPERLGLLATELQSALVMPPFTRTIRKLVRSLLRAKRSSRYAEPTILAFLLGNTTAVTTTFVSASSSGGNFGAAVGGVERWPAERTEAAEGALTAALTPLPSAPATRPGRISFEAHTTAAGKKLSSYIQAMLPSEPKHKEGAGKSKGAGCVVS